MPEETRGYHLFLEPSGEAREQLQSLIASLAASEGGPLFPPHITLLAEIDVGSEEEILETCTLLAKGNEPFMVSLGEAGMEDRYFRALYLRVQESTPLWALHERAAAAFAKDDAEPYMPHVSLLYGNYEEERKRAALAALPVPEGMSFLIDRIHVYRTQGPVSEWRKIAELPFDPH